MGHMLYCVHVAFLPTLSRLQSLSEHTLLRTCCIPLSALRDNLRMLALRPGKLEYPYGVGQCDSAFGVPRAVID